MSMLESNLPGRLGHGHMATTASTITAGKKANNDKNGCVEPENGQSIGHKHSAVGPAE